MLTLLSNENLIHEINDAAKQFNGICKLFTLTKTKGKKTPKPTPYSTDIQSVVHYWIRKERDA